jgi:PEP-CTERM motif
MKKSTPLLLGLAFAACSATARADYQSTVSGQSPDYYFQFDNSLSSVGNTATFTAHNGATFASDYFGNANGAASFPAAGSTEPLNDYLAGSASILSGAGTSTAVGSLSLLFYVPSSIPTTAYYFSDGDASSGSYFAFAFGGGDLNLKLVNKTFTAANGLPAGASLTPDSWYYLALTWDLTGTATGVNGVNWYIGQAGQSGLSSGFFQKGGSGNINTSGTLGGGGTMDLNAKTSGASGVAGGGIDELATWSTQLSSADIIAQYNALAVPEPSSLIVFGAGALAFLTLRRKAHRA